MTTILATAAQPVRPETPEPPTWQASLKAAIRDPKELCRQLELSTKLCGQAKLPADSFPLLAPREYVARIRQGDLADPLLRQIMPLAEEKDEVSGFTTDPVRDSQATLTPGMLQKYAGRVLLITTGACAVHCRYCFRRHFPYSEAPKGVAAWASAIDAIRKDTSLREVILSGGDPLTLVDSTLSQLAEQLAAVPHLTRLRIHTRLPIMIPQRVNDELLAWLTNSRLTPYMVVHANHAQEIDGAVADSLGRLVDAGIPVMNQAALLRGVNDTADAQAELCERLINLRVLPYYLNQLDRVAGAAHFEVPIETGRKIIEELHRCLPGYAVPRYVQDREGGTHKFVLA